MDDFGFTINTLLGLTVIVSKLIVLHNLDWGPLKWNKFNTRENIQSTN
jgi:hypothetical protein